MERNMLRVVAAVGVAACAGAIGAVSGVVAQDTRTPTAEMSTTTPRVVTPRRSDRTPPGVQTSKSSGEPDWEQVRAIVAQTRERDAAFQRQIRAMELTRAITAEEMERQRPKGLRAVAPQQLELVRPEVVRTPRFPVLAPVTVETIGVMRVAAHEDAFTAFGDLPGGAFFEVIGTRLHVIGGTPEIMKIRASERRRLAKRLEGIDAPYTISRHEYGVDLSFSKFNIAYQISITCPDVDGDARCAGDDYILSLAENLAILNEDGGATP